MVLFWFTIGSGVICRADLVPDLKMRYAKSARIFDINLAFSRGHADQVSLPHLNLMHMVTSVNSLARTNGD